MRPIDHGSLRSVSRFPARAHPIGGMQSTPKIAWSDAMFDSWMRSCSHPRKLWFKVHVVVTCCTPDPENVT